MKRNHICICPACDHIEEQLFDYKTTVACERCHRPYEAYEDGRMEYSALYECVGYVEYTPKKCHALGMHNPILRTLTDDIRDYNCKEAFNELRGRHNKESA